MRKHLGAWGSTIWVDGHCAFQKIVHYSDQFLNCLRNQYFVSISNRPSPLSRTLLDAITYLTAVIALDTAGYRSTVLYDFASLLVPPVKPAASVHYKSE
jgi:hypothetical protein